MTHRRLAVRVLALGLLGTAGFAWAGCGESAPAPAPETATDGDGTTGRRTSTLGKAMDRAEQVVGEIEENQQRAVDLADELDGVTEPGEDG